MSHDTHHTRKLKTMTTLTITTGLSSTIKSAQSKKCRMLQKVRANEMHVKVAIAIMNADHLLSTVMTQKDIEDAAAGLKPSRGRSGSIELTIVI